MCKSSVTTTNFVYQGRGKSGPLDSNYKGSTNVSNANADFVLKPSPKPPQQNTFTPKPWYQNRKCFGHNKQFTTDERGGHYIKKPNVNSDDEQPMNSDADGLNIGPGDEWKVQVIKVDYERNLLEMDRIFEGKYSKALDYVKINWLKEYKDRFVVVWIDTCMHFSNTTSNRGYKYVGADPIACSYVIRRSHGLPCTHEMA
ncbi:hypothetical protein L3X38_032249 [Prunus dulcis]|uniref:Uncharacterized protein n=1 Tax=Prunus dulcis TaxID=3755 RepID=A0AAD4VFY9_PRUDU|nr:hypothetical protein L3X38_032249 [Prunus dulcis]